MKRNTLWKSLIASLLAVVMVVGAVEIGLFPSLKAVNTAAAGTVNTIVDLDTSTKYMDSLGDNASTEYSGRIWTDKSVYSNDVTFVTFGGNTSTIKKDAGEDFLITYSALGTSKSVSGEAQAPVDVVFIIDISGSMSNSDSEMDNGYSRIANTVSAVNESIDKLMAENEYSRVAVVAFSDTAQVLMPLDHYAKYSQGATSYNYLSLNSTSAGGNVTLYVRADGENSNVTKYVSVSGGTNIQMGLYTGMNVLATATDISANINGQLVKRVPSVVMLSDGAPTFSSGNTYNSTSNWWAPLNNDNDGPGSAAYYGNGFKALMTGAYMKNAINENYGVTGTKMEATLYTVGMGISDLSNYGGRNNNYTGEKDLAYMTLNPKDNWSSTNTMATSVKTAWTNYTNQTVNGNGTISVTVNNNDTYTVRHPQSPLKDIYTSTNKDALKNLVDDYYDADNASSVANVFDQIVSNISISAPEVPTEIRSDDVMSTGYITYTDPIGEYMRVKDVKAIIYAGTTFTNKTTKTEDNKVTYIFEGSVHSEVYGDQSIENIVITVEANASGNQTLTVKIPASVIPLRVNTVELNENGTVKTHTNNGAYPARVIYSVAMKDGLKKTCDHGEVYVDLTQVSADYVKNNLNDDGTINFYANYFNKENPNMVNGSTAGNAYVEFEPSHTNPFYYILEDMPIYKDVALTQQLTVQEGIDEDTTYYYNDTYYHGSIVETRAIARTGKQLLALTDLTQNTIKEGADGYLYRATGSPRLNRILRFEGTKTLNATNTAEDFYGATFIHADGSTDPYEGFFKVYLGNNGVMQLLGGGNLKVTKQVESADGVTAPNKEFTFTLDLNGDDVSNLVLNYLVTDAFGNQVKTGTLQKTANTFTLKDGETATIFSLPPETTYTVTETAEAGFSTVSQGASGQIMANETSEALFTNTYSVTPVTFPTNTTLKATKVLVGRTWNNATDAFTFFLAPYNNAPLPAGYDAVNGITVAQANTTVDGYDAAEFDFGSINFTAPGTYRYTIYEDEPANNEYLPGMSYSRALYRLVVEVVDNGDGTLSIASQDIQQLLDDNANPQFTYVDGEIVINPTETAQDDLVFINQYSANSVTRVPVALKNYTDNSGKKPLVSGMFNFKLQAVGYKVDDGSDSYDLTKVPMPQDNDGVHETSITTNEGHNIAFLPVEFTHATLTQLSATNKVTFYYQMSEVVPDGAVNNVYQGMIYDDTVFDIEVVVSIDALSNTLVVNAIYPDGLSVATFNNVYSPEPAYADINGAKTMVGRDMLDGETFTFKLEGADSVTSSAITNGDIVIPNATASVSGHYPADFAQSFAFNNIQFKKPGVYKLKVTEIKGTAKSVKYDESEIIVSVYVEDTAGVLDAASISYSNGLTRAEFTNTYTSTFTDTPLTITGTKNLTGKTLLEGEFYFEVAGFDPLGNEIMRSLVTHEEDLTPDANGVYSGTITFLENMTFDKAGEYTFYIVEMNNNVPNTQYDTSQYCITVVVEDDYEGNLSVKSVDYKIAENATLVPANHSIIFTNSYAPTPLETTLPIIHKVIDGDRAAGLNANEFKFQLSLAPNSPDGVILPTNVYAFNDSQGNVEFDQVTFTKAGYYTLVITEVLPNINDRVPGITYSQQVIELTYHVVDDRVGNLTAILVNMNGGTTITNGYTPQESDAVNIEIKKDLTGRDWLDTDEFTFTIVAGDEATKQAIQDGNVNIVLDANSSDTVTVKVDKNNSIASVPVSFKKIGTYTFKITEVKGNINGIDYDESEYVITIVVTDNSLIAKLETEVTIEKDASKADGIVFTNTYEADEVKLEGATNLKVTKDFTGRKNNAWLDTDQFVFNIEGADDTTLAAIGKGDIVFTNTALTITNANKSNAYFGDITFKKAGTYKFKVTEQQGNLGGITYDKEAKYVTVEVTDNLTEGKLEVVTIATQSDELKFSNFYEVDPNGVTVDLEALKKLTGRDLKAEEFTFIVKDKDGNTVMTLTNDKDGKITFEQLKFTEEGTYTYTISEVKGTDTKIVYDQTVFTVEIVVSDNNAGKLVASDPVISNGTKTVDQIVFQNVVLSDPVDTGDFFNNLLLTTLIVVTGGLVLVTVYRKKKESEN